MPCRWVDEAKQPASGHGRADILGGVSAMETTAGGCSAWMPKQRPGSFLGSHVAER